MRAHRPLVLLFPVLAATVFLVGATCGPNEAHRRRISGVRVDTPEEDAGPPQSPEGFLPRRFSSGDRYHRTDTVTSTQGEHNKSVRIEREVIVESVGTDGAILMSERVREVHIAEDGRETPLPRELRDVSQAVARYRTNVHGELLGEVDITGGTPEATTFVHDTTLVGLTQGVFDKTHDMRPTDHRASQRTIPLSIDEVHPDLHLEINYTLRSLDDREARVELDAAGEIAETPLPGRGHNKLRGSANMTGAMSIDPRDGFAGTYRDELHLFYTVRDESNHPRGPAESTIVTTETTISRAP